MEDIIRILEENRGNIGVHNHWQLNRAIWTLQNIDFTFDYLSEIDYQVDENMNYEAEEGDEKYVTLSRDEREEVAMRIMDSDWMNEQISEAIRDEIHYFIDQRKRKEEQEQQQKEDIFNEF